MAGKRFALFYYCQSLLIMREGVRGVTGVRGVRGSKQLLTIVETCHGTSLQQSTINNQLLTTNH